jgi:hypothetical protein
VSTRSSLIYRSQFLTLPHHRFLSPSFSSTYKSLFPQLLSFLIYTKPPGVPTPCRARASRRRVHFQLSTVLSAICRLFGSVAKLNSLVFKGMPTLSQKNTGCVYKSVAQGILACAPTNPARSFGKIVLGPMANVRHPSSEFRVPSFEFRAFAFRVSLLPQVAAPLQRCHNFGLFF